MRKPEIRASAGILLSGTRILLEQRAADAYIPFKWQFPGGEALDHESDDLALRRELREELGIDVLASRLLGRVSHEYYAGIDTVVSFYLVERYRGKVVPAENQVLRWVDLTEAESLDVITANREVLVDVASAAYSPEFVWDGIWSTSSKKFGHPIIRRFRVERKLRAIERLGFRVGADDRVLDIGCGSAEAAYLISDGLRSRGHEEVGRPVISLDRSRVALQRANRFEDTEARVAVVVNSDAIALPLRSGWADKVLAFSILEHVVDPDSFLSEAERVLAPGGELYVCQSNTLSVLTCDRLARQWFGRWKYGYQRSYTPGQLTRLLGRFFSVEVVDIDLPQSDVRVYQAIDAAVNFVWPKWGRTILVRARKRS